ncbi:MAG: hypothetical protein V3W51_03430 [Candidatus Brocadiales bacterium]
MKTSLTEARQPWRLWRLFFFVAAQIPLEEVEDIPAEFLLDTQIKAACAGLYYGFLGF